MNQFDNQEHQLQVFLFTYRTTVHRATGSTPAKLFLNRELATVFDRLKPDHMNDIQSLKSKFYHDRTSKNKSYEIGDKVWIKRPIDQKWNQGVISEKTGPLSYRTQNNLRVHADHLRNRNVEESTTPLPSKESDQPNTPDLEPIDLSESIIPDPDRDPVPDQTPDPVPEATQQSPRRSTRTRNPPKRFHDEFNY